MEKLQRLGVGYRRASWVTVKGDLVHLWVGHVGRTPEVSSVLRHSIAIANWKSDLFVVGRNEQHTLAVSCGMNCLPCASWPVGKMAQGGVMLCNVVG